MKVVVPYAGPLDSRVVENLPPDATTVDVSGSDEAYFDLLEALWAQGETFLIVEHDMAVHRGVYDALVTCNGAWCQVPYLVAGQVQGALGVARFHKVLLRDRECPLDPSDRFWAHQDVNLHLGLVSQGINPHLHPELSPFVMHLNPKAAITPGAKPAKRWWQKAKRY